MTFCGVKFLLRITKRDCAREQKAGDKKGSNRLKTEEQE
jgi:hypothetical protein